MIDLASDELIELNEVLASRTEDIFLQSVWWERKRRKEGRKEVDDGKEEGMMARGSGWGICLVLVGRAGLGFSFACCELV